MDRHIKEGTVTYQFFVDKLGGKNREDFVGDEGMIFYDPTLGDLRISDDVTPGGIPLLQTLVFAPAGNTIVIDGNTVPLPGADPRTVVYKETMVEALGILNYGNVKHGFQETDHFGWVLLDGRAKALLTDTQRAIASELGWGTYIPNSTGRVLKMTGETPGAVGGLPQNQYLVQQNQLPQIPLEGATNGFGYNTEDHAGATLGLSGSWLREGGASVNFGGTGQSVHFHDCYVDLNPTGSQIPTNVENMYMAMNTFAYLGL